MHCMAFLELDGADVDSQNSRGAIYEHPTHVQLAREPCSHARIWPRISCGS